MGYRDNTGFPLQGTRGWTPGTFTLLFIRNRISETAYSATLTWLRLALQLDNNTLISLGVSAFYIGLLDPIVAFPGFERLPFGK